MDEEYGIEEGFGQETDDWMMDETRKEFISFRDSPGDILVLFTGKPVKGRSKYQKDQYWFPVEQVIDMEAGVVEEKTLSTSSNQLRKKLTKIYTDHPKMFEGKTIVNIRWSGNGMDRSYSVIAPVYESQCLIMDKIHPGRSVE
jgi:hypothetical protein